jgi:hypothetical protein
VVKTGYRGMMTACIHDVSHQEWEPNVKEIYQLRRSLLWKDFRSHEPTLHHHYCNQTFSKVTFKDYYVIEVSAISI